TADDVLSPDISPVTEDTTLEVVAKRLINEKISGIPVVDEKNNFLGEITEKELIEYGMPKYLSLMKDLDFLTVGEPFEEYLLKEETATIKDLYRRKENLYTIDKKTPIMEICFIMVKKGITRIYVVENGKLHGVIRRYDIIKKVLHI
ncbi:CBS domain-containing protein, partial [Fusobacterium perfoetens]|uniref:CBS domain-containing protein n=2 Tax=Fusobacterium perfoetens TaxID=852 RepID=UPI000480AC91